MECTKGEPKEEMRILADSGWTRLSDELDTYRWVNHVSPDLLITYCCASGFWTILREEAGDFVSLAHGALLQTVARQVQKVASRNAIEWTQVATHCTRLVNVELRDCSDCNTPQSMRKTWLPETIPVGTRTERTTLTVTVPVWFCANCSSAYTEEEAARIRHETVQDYYRRK